MKKKLRILTVSALCFGMMTASTISANAQTVNWNVYEYSGHYYPRTVLPISNSGLGYTATCSSVGGNATYISTTIKEYTNYACTNEVSLNRSVAFSRAGTSVTFKHNNLPDQDVVYMRAVMTYKNGTSASMAGSIAGR